MENRKSLSDKAGTTIAVVIRKGLVYLKSENHIYSSVFLIKD